MFHPFYLKVLYVTRFYFCFRKSFKYFCLALQTLAVKSSKCYFPIHTTKFLFIWLINFYNIKSKNKSTERLYIKTQSQIVPQIVLLFTGCRVHQTPPINWSHNHVLLFCFWIGNFICILGSYCRWHIRFWLHIISK